MNLKASQILLSALLAIFAIALLQSIDESRADVTYCTFCCSSNCGGANGNSTPTPTPTPTPSPGPSATPTPLPATIVVNASGGDDFTTIQAAVDTAVPGDVIKVKSGTYQEFNTGSRHGTESQPIYIENFAGHSPIIEPGFTSGDQIQLNAEWWIVRGFEIKGGYFGMRILDDNIVVADNVFHNAGFNGLMVVPQDEAVSNFKITGNTFKVIGYTESGTCDLGSASSCTVREINSDTSAKNRHAVYISNSTCNGISNGIVEWNHFENLGGRAIQLNGLLNGSESICAADGINNIIIRNNTITNASWGISLFYGSSEVFILNNVATLNNWPNTNDSDHTFIGVWGLTNSQILSNVVSSTSSSMRPFHFYDSSSGCPENDIDLNTWDLNTNDWIWNESGRSDFSTNFTSVSGCGSNDIHN